MNDENKIDLSIEMYEDLKETLVKAIKNAKAGSRERRLGEYAAGTDRAADRGRGTFSGTDYEQLLLTTTESNIEHVCIPLTDAQIIGLYNINYCTDSCGCFSKQFRRI